ncbi:tyrosine-protein kinase FRK isoform X2 [Scophthalmus maximus]|uniref:tyrosine-protein kinase FRK isoform X2 n=1 Tax=Scophthalmus maximus TaxID=52904 RepID=UPI0015E0F864|nr:tyrosine-protein kinase FRK isoform X2 [Scophthalmus maximus]
MEIQKRLSSCWQSFLACFKKPRRSAGDPVRQAARNPGPGDNAEPAAGGKSSAPAETAGDYYIALYDYSARTEEDLSFHAGDILEALDKSPGEWWFAQAASGLSASKQGYIPANYVAPVESINAEPWYFPETKRQDAEKMLLAGGNQHGAFLIRNCESQKGELSLSVVDSGRVKHYKLKKMDNGQYFVSKTRCFQTLKELVEHYSRQSDGLCVRLGEPCKKMEAPQTHGLSYNTVDQWEIDRNSIKLLRKLGAGQFGEVFEGIWNETTAVAVKTLKPEDNGKTLRISDQIEMAAQVASGMAFLELQNYIHRDLAARNVLVGENNICKIADFGLARVFMKENESVYEAKEGTKFPVKWTAPEAINDNKFTIKSDVWSFGILLYEIMTFGQMPYPAMSNYQVVQKIPQGYRMTCPPNCPKVMYDIMIDCWKEDEQDRPTFETLQWKLEDFFDMDVTSYDDASRY